MRRRMGALVQTAGMAPQGRGTMHLVKNDAKTARGRDAAKLKRCSEYAEMTHFVS